jgi:ABC-type lipoprotein release transport system permease subunit
MLKFFLALRYLKKRRIVFLSIAAVMLSTALLVTVASLFTAFIRAIELNASEYMGDIVLEPVIRITRYDELLARLNENENIDSATPVLSSSGLIYLDAGNVRAVTFWGIDLQSRCRVTNFKNNLLLQKKSENLISFNNDPNNTAAALVGVAMLTEPDAKTDKYDFTKAESYIGKKAVLTTGTLGNIGEQTKGVSLTRSVPVTISDVVFTAVYEIDKRFVFLPIEQLSKLLLGDDTNIKAADTIHIKCKAGVSPAKTIETVRQIWLDFATQQLDWPESFANDSTIVTAMKKQADYTDELKKQMGVLLIVFGIISAGIIVLVFCIFYMIVKAKLKDLAIVKSIGASAADIIAIFLLFGLFVGVIGAAGGIATGYIITHNVNTIEQFVSQLFGMKLWDSSTYMFTKIPSQFDWFWATWFFFAAIIASVLGAVVPSLIAAKTSPVKILRYE